MGEEDLRIASTTDSQERVNEAAGLPPEGDAEQPGTLTEELEPEEARPTEETGQRPQERPHQPRYRGGLQKRIDRLTAEKYELQERLRAAEEAARRPQLPRPNAPGNETERWREHDPSGSEPSFVPQEEVERRADELVQKRRDAEANAAENARLQQLAASHQQRMTEALGKRADRDAVLEKSKSIGIHPWVMGAVMTMPNSQDLALHFVDHPEDLAAIHQATGAEEAYGTIVRLSERLRLQSTPRSRPPVSRAPAPTVPIGTSSTMPVELDQTDYQTFKREREKQVQRRYR